MASAPGKALIWDLGNTLLKADTMCFAREIGLSDFILYFLLDWKNPKKIHELAFKLLDQTDHTYHEAYSLATARGAKLPALICHWLSGKASPEEMAEKIASILKESNFSNAREKRLITQTLNILINPEQFTGCMKPIEKGITLLNECATKTDAHGKKLHTMYVLSNWDPHTFKQLLILYPGLFAYFDPENIVISGDIKAIKPHPSIYQSFLLKYNLIPENCILIDDQIENITAAEKIGITGLFLHNENYDEIKKQLIALSVL